MATTKNKKLRLLKRSKPKPVAVASSPTQRRGLRMRIHGDGKVDVTHLMREGGMFAPGLVELSDSDGPAWIQVAQAGEYFKSGYPFKLNAQVFTDIITNFNTTKNRVIPIDFEHASEADATEGEIPIRGAPAQGWITKLEMREDGESLWALVDWLPLARQYIKSGQYKFFSPAIRFNARDKTTGKVIGARMTSGALTNNPFLDGMVPLAARDFEEEPLTVEEATNDEVHLRYDIEGQYAPRLNLDVNVLQAMEGIRDVISAILPQCEHDDDDEEDEPPSAPSNPIVAAIPVATYAMSDKETVTQTPVAPATVAETIEAPIDMNTISLADHETKLTAATAELQLTLKDANSKLELSNTRIAELETQLVSLRESENARESKRKSERVDAAFGQYRDAKKLSDLDKEAMVVLLDSKPEIFEKLYPVIDSRAVVMTARLSAERPTVALPSSVARPSITELAAKYQSEGKDYETAFTLAMKDLEPKKL
jgi:phage I-like protein